MEGRRRLSAWEVLILYFGPDREGKGRPVTPEELRQMPLAERKELARQAAQELGVELIDL
jgi:hypothetical protein